MRPAVPVVPSPGRAPGEPQEAEADGRGPIPPHADLAGEAKDARVLRMRARVRHRTSARGPHEEAQGCHDRRLAD